MPERVFAARIEAVVAGRGFLCVECEFSKVRANEATAPRLKCAACSTPLRIDRRPAVAAALRTRMASALAALGFGIGCGVLCLKAWPALARLLGFAWGDMADTAPECAPGMQHARARAPVLTASRQLHVGTFQIVATLPCLLCDSSKTPHSPVGSRCPDLAALARWMPQTVQLALANASWGVQVRGGLCAAR